MQPDPLMMNFDLSESGKQQAEQQAALTTTLDINKHQPIHHIDDHNSPMLNRHKLTTHRDSSVQDSPGIARTELGLGRSLQFLKSHSP